MQKIKGCGLRIHGAPPHQGKSDADKVIADGGVSCLQEAYMHDTHTPTPTPTPTPAPTPTSTPTQWHAPTHPHTRMADRRVSCLQEALVE